MVLSAHKPINRDNGVLHACSPNPQKLHEHIPKKTYEKRPSSKQSTTKKPNPQHMIKPIKDNQNQCRPQSQLSHLNNCVPSPQQWSIESLSTQFTTQTLQGQELINLKAGKQLKVQPKQQQMFKTGKHVSRNSLIQQQTVQALVNYMVTPKQTVCHESKLASERHTSTLKRCKSQESMQHFYKTAGTVIDQMEPISTIVEQSGDLSQMIGQFNNESQMSQTLQQQIEYINQKRVMLPCECEKHEAKQMGESSVSTLFHYVDETYKKSNQVAKVIYQTRAKKNPLAET